MTCDECGKPAEIAITHLDMTTQIPYVGCYCKECGGRIVATGHFQIMDADERDYRATT